MPRRHHHHRRVPQRQALRQAPSSPFHRHQRGQRARGEQGRPDQGLQGLGKGILSGRRGAGADAHNQTVFHHGKVPRCH